MNFAQYMLYSLKKRSYFIPAPHNGRDPESYPQGGGCGEVRLYDNSHSY